MNGITTVLPPEERAARKRQLQDDLVLVRTQKAEVLRQIQQIAKRQKTSLVAGPLSVEERRLLKREEQRRRMDIIWQTCLKMVQELLKNSNTRTYFGEPVKVEYVPTYYQARAGQRKDCAVVPWARLYAPRWHTSFGGHVLICCLFLSIALSDHQESNGPGHD